MQKYIDDVLKLAKVRGQVSTPATLQLFDVDEEAAVLSAGEKQLFHSFVAKLYYLPKRARPDILTALSFLTTRVHAPTQVVYVLHPADGPVRVETYTDAAYGNHQDFKSHTGHHLRSRASFCEVHETDTAGGQVFCGGGTGRSRRLGDPSAMGP
jgi:hypothetical protein